MAVMSHSSIVTTSTERTLVCDVNIDRFPWIPLLKLASEKDGEGPEQMLGVSQLGLIR